MKYYAVIQESKALVLKITNTYCFFSVEKEIPVTSKRILQYLEHCLENSFSGNIMLFTSLEDAIKESDYHARNHTVSKEEIYEGNTVIVLSEEPHDRSDYQTFKPIIEVSIADTNTLEPYYAGLHDTHFYKSTYNNLTMMHGYTYKKGSFDHTEIVRVSLEQPIPLNFEGISDQFRHSA